MQYINKFCKLDRIVNFVNTLKSSSHSILLCSEDEIFLDCIAKLIVLNDCCKNDKPCFKCINCNKILNKNSVDVKYFGESKNIVVEDSSNIINESYIVPLEFNKRYFILKNIDRATISAQNKLLKVLEEPQKFNKFILLTTKEDAVLQTIKSRCEKIYLPKLNNDELQYLFEYKIHDAKKYNIAIDYASGNLSVLEQIYEDTFFMELYNLTLNMLTLMQNSTMILEYSSKILSYKQDIKKFLQILSSFFADMVCIKRKRENSIQNKQIMVQLKLISGSYNELALLNILKEIDKVNLKLDYNANVNNLIDNLLLKILEIKHKCKL